MGLWGRSSGIQNFNRNDRAYFQSKALAFSPCECSTTTQFLVPFEDIFSHEGGEKAERGRYEKKVHIYFIEKNIHVLCVVE